MTVTEKMLYDKGKGDALWGYTYNNHMDSSYRKGYCDVYVELARTLTALSKLYNNEDLLKAATFMEDCIAAL